MICTLNWCSVAEGAADMNRVVVESLTPGLTSKVRRHHSLPFSAEVENFMPWCTVKHKDTCYFHTFCKHSVERFALGMVPV
jgi:hypothetical protein